MAADQVEVEGPDLSLGIRLSDIPDRGMIGGHVNGKTVLLARRGKKIYAIGGLCSHYSAPLADGLMVGKTVRCPWHHACFDLRTGEATCAPALSPVSVWEVERDGERVKVTREIPPATLLPRSRKALPLVSPPNTIVIVGAGAAGNAAAEMLRREGFEGAVTMIGAEDSVPYDRPNLSKEYLAGTAPEEWIPLRPPEFYAEHRIELLSNVRVLSIDTSARTVALSDGPPRQFDRLLLATGAEPVKPAIPGAELSHVHYLRTLADSRAIINASGDARKIVIIGASFIGLEVAASLRARGLQVDVAGPEHTPLERVLGRDLGTLVKTTHEKHGVTFHPGRGVAGITRESVRLDNGASLPADVVVVGVGVRPLTKLAIDAGLDMSRGVAVDQYLETSVAGIFAAGDIARYPDARFGADLRVEHWVHAERQGQIAAKNMLGRARSFSYVPFFWSNHYDLSIQYVGHAERWDDVKVVGDIGAGDCAVAYLADDKILAVATVGRERTSIEAEVALEDADWKKLTAMFDRGEEVEEDSEESAAV